LPKVSIVIPSRNELFLVKTVNDLLAKAHGDIEILVVLDGYWEHDLPADPRVKQLHFGQARGMRPGINAGIAASTGDYILKCDGHTLWDEGYDLKLIQNYHEDNWILVPRRYALDPENWRIEQGRPDNKYPIDYHMMVEPFNSYGDSNPGLHGTEWRQRREQRKHIQLDDEMSSQGSGWFISRKCWEWLGPQDVEHYGNFVHEFQEMGLKCWLGGGAVKVLKDTYYCHLYKGKRYGRMYSMQGSNHDNGVSFCTWFWMTDQPFKNRVHNLKWLIEKFAPVPTWPADLDEIFARARRECRSPYAVAA